MTEPVPGSADVHGRVTSGRAVRRALTAMAAALATQLAPRDSANGWLGTLDARAKVVTAVVLIVTASLLQQPLALAGLLVLCVTAWLASGLGWQRAAPVWLGAPLFTLIVVLPAALSLFTPGNSLAVLWKGGGQIGPWQLPGEIAVTGDGLVVVARLVMRSAACVSLALLLTVSTQPAALVNGLRRLGMPRAFGMVLTMMQRYLAALLDAGEQLHMAKLSRTISPDSTRAGQRWAASGIGMLLLRSLRLAEEVHMAMRARGFDGDIRVYPGHGWRGREWAVVAAGIAVSASFLLLDKVF